VPLALEATLVSVRSALVVTVSVSTALQTPETHDVDVFVLETLPGGDTVTVLETLVCANVEGAVTSKTKNARNTERRRKNCPPPKETPCRTIKELNVYLIATLHTVIRDPTRESKGAP
jgi:hypothetical protein